MVQAFVESAEYGAECLGRFVPPGHFYPRSRLRTTSPGFERSAANATGRCDLARAHSVNLAARSMLWSPRSKRIPRTRPCPWEFQIQPVASPQPLQLAVRGGGFCLEGHLVYLRGPDLGAGDTLALSRRRHAGRPVDHAQHRRSHGGSQRSGHSADQHPLSRGTRHHRIPHRGQRFVRRNFGPAARAGANHSDPLDAKRGPYHQAENGDGAHAGADWIVPIDADEFWSAGGGCLA